MKNGLLKRILPYPKKQLVFWVGAGISINKPTSLPAGQPLTTFSLAQTCGKEVQQRIVEIWQEANNILNKDAPNARIGIIPRLESILDVISDVESRSSNCRFRFMNGFASYLQAPHNDNHYYLAELLSEGSVIITTNFDLCIEQAYEHFSQGKDILVPEERDGVIVYCSENIADAGEIWHIHGTVKDIDTLGATIRKVKEGLTPTVQQYLDRLFADNSAVIFLGYSFSDAFDVNPYFGSKRDDQFRDSLALYIKHDLTGQEAPFPHIEKLLRCFGTYEAVSDDTSKVLSHLAGLKHQPSGSFDWEASFLHEADFTDRDFVQAFLTCSIANLLGIQAKKLDARVYSSALGFEKHFPKDSFHDTMGVVLRNEGKHRPEKRHHLSKTNVLPISKGDMLGYYYAIGNYREAARHAKQIDELFEDAFDPDKELDWKTYTSMSAYCRPLVMKYLKKPLPKRVSNEDEKTITRLISLTDLLGNRPLKNILFINQHATALRLHMLLKALILGKDDSEAQDRILYLYGEGASVAGLISAYRDIASKHYFLAKYRNAKSQLNDAIRYAKTSLDLAKLVGNIPGVRRARGLLWYFRASKLLSVLY